jgi:hypothetical protein
MNCDFTCPYRVMEVSMKKFGVLSVFLIFMLVLTACGKTEGESGVPKTNDIQVAFSENEQYNPGSFELKKTLGFISGIRYNAVSTAKHAYVALANYDVQLGLYSVEPPQGPDQIVVVISFKTENQEVSLENQMESYGQMAVPTGTYSPGWMSEDRSFQVHYFVGGKEGGPSISGSGASGSAALTTSTPQRVIGRIDFTSPKGSTIKGTFNVKIEKDLWKH